MNRLPLLALHGIFGTLDSSGIWSGLGGRRVLAPPLLGYRGAPPPPSTIEGLDHQAAYVASVLDDARIDRAHVLGHSAGGIVAALLADRMPHRIASFVNVEGNFTLRDAFMSRTLVAGTLSDADAQAAKLRDDPAPWFEASDVRFAAMPEGAAEAWARAQDGAALLAQAQGVLAATSGPEYDVLLRRVFARTPVLLVAGRLSRADWDVPSWAVEASAGHIELDGGHLMMLDHARPFASAVEAFLADHD